MTYKQLGEMIPEPGAGDFAQRLSDYLSLLLMQLDRSFSSVGRDNFDEKELQKIRSSPLGLFGKCLVEVTDGPKVTLRVSGDADVALDITGELTVNGRAL